MFSTADIADANIIYLLIFFGLLLYVIPFAAILMSALRLAIFPCQLERIDAATDISPSHQAAIDELVALGFSPPVVHYHYIEGTQEYRGVLLRHTTEPAFARLDFRALAGLGYYVFFYSFTSEGISICTVRHLLLIAAPHMRVRYANTQTVAGQWQTHLANVKKQDCVMPDNEEAFARVAALLDGAYKHSCATGKLVPEADYWMWSVPTALHLAFLAIWHRKLGKSRPMYKVAPEL